MGPVMKGRGGEHGHRYSYMAAINYVFELLPVVQLLATANSPVKVSLKLTYFLLSTKTGSQKEEVPFVIFSLQQPHGYPDPTCPNFRRSFCSC